MRLLQASAQGISDTLAKTVLSNNPSYAFRCTILDGRDILILNDMLAHQFYRVSHF